ncbi:MAG TPA: DJ-1/PfpI family protein [Thermoplasmata archaeon]|nr:DJ-1/PfpI family protein [Thermoplasmata archaeon]
MTHKLAGKRVLMVIAQKQFRDEELFIPKQILEGEGASVTVASEHGGNCDGMLGGRAHADIMIARADAAAFDAVVVVGGAGSPQWLWDSAPLHKTVRAAQSSSKVVGAICLGPGALAKAGVLKGAEATVYETPDSLRALREGGAKFVRKECVVAAEHKLVTASGPQAAKEFGLALVAAIATG